MRAMILAAGRGERMGPLTDKIPKPLLGNGERYGVSILYSEEKECLETGGGILQALPLLGQQPFLVMSSDIITDYPIKKMLIPPPKLAHLVLVDNPPYHPQGDFGLFGINVDIQAQPALTFGNIGIYRPELFAHCQPGYFRISDVLFPAINNGQITGENYQGTWYNIGTYQDLEEINAAYIS